MLRCAAFLVIAAYAKVRLIPPNLRALPLEHFARSFEDIQLTTFFYKFIKYDCIVKRQ